MCPSSTPAAWSAAPTALRRSPGTSERSISAALGVAGPASALGLSIGGDDPLHQLVPDHVLAAEADEVDVLDLAQDVADLDQPGAGAALEVDLGDVAGDHELGAEPEPG